MMVRGTIIAFFAILFTATSVLAGGGGGGGGGVGGTPFDLLLPDPPKNITATAGNGEATVEFKPPKSDGGSPILRYDVIARPGRIKATGKQSPITVRGLKNGTCYTFTVTASNSTGTGFESDPSNSVTPKAE